MQEKILIVEDDVPLASLLSEYLSSQGYKIEVLHRGLDVKKRVIAGHPDLVILDTPPTLVVADARIISKLADAVVFAVRWDKTPRGAVIEGLKELRSIGAPIAGVVMTLVNEGRASKYSYDGYNYYKGKYRDYYGT